MGGKLPDMARRWGVSLSILVAAAALTVAVQDGPAGFRQRSHPGEEHAVAPTIPPRAPQPPGDAVRAKVTRVVDGDTLIVRWHGRRERVRLIGVDAPELREWTLQPWSSRCRPARCAPDSGGIHLGRRAAEALRRLAPPGSVVRLARDREPRDRYGRALRYVWNQRGEFVNSALIRSGSARPMIITPNTRFRTALLTAEP